MEHTDPSKQDIIQVNRAFFDNVNDLNLTVANGGYAFLTSRWHGANYSSPYNRLYLMHSGMGVLRANGETVTMEPGNIYLIPAGLRFDFHCPQALQKLYFHVNLQKPDHYDLFQSLGKIGQLPLPEALLQEMIGLYQSNSFAACLQLKQHLYRILAEFQRSYGLAVEQMTLYSEHVADTLAYIQANLSAKLTVTSLAQRRFLSQSSLAELFRREVGVTIGRYIDDQLLISAQTMLSRTGKSIGTISAALGYTDQFYFSRRFKQLCGETPLQYRKKAKAYDNLLQENPK